jgi:hypothetical protein
MGGTDKQWIFRIFYFLLAAAISANYQFRGVLVLNRSVCRPHSGSHLDGVHVSFGKPYYLSILLVFKTKGLISGSGRNIISEHASSTFPDEP